MRSRVLLFAACMVASGSALAQHQALVLHGWTSGVNTATAQTQGLGMGRALFPFTGPVRYVVGHAKDGGVFKLATWSPRALDVVGGAAAVAGYTGATLQESSVTSDAGSGTLAGGARHALVSAGSVTDLHPAAGWDWTTAWGASSTTQVGWGVAGGGPTHALMWTGTAASMVDLHPAGYKNSKAYGASASDQVGEGVVNFAPRALRWTGSAASAQDLTPAGHLGAGLRASTGSIVGGFVIPKGAGRQAAVWTGSPLVATNLHPSGYLNSIVWDVDGSCKAGHGKDSSGRQHALVWVGASNLVYDLNSALPVGYTDAMAFGVDAEGNVAGQAKFSDGKWHAVYWAADRALDTLTPANLSSQFPLAYAGQLDFSFVARTLLGERLAYEFNRISLATHPAGAPVATATFSNSGDSMSFDDTTGVYAFRLNNTLPNGLYKLTVNFANGWKKFFLIQKVG